MSFHSLFAPADISASGLSAERLRMEVAANNIANVRSVRAGGGEPFRRQMVVFSAAGAEHIGSAAGRSPLFSRRAWNFRNG